MPAPTAPPPSRPPLNPNTVKGVLAAFAPIESSTGHRIVVYGPGGIGKTTLATQMPGRTVFYDLDESLPRLREGLPNASDILTCPTPDWKVMRDTLHAPQWDGVQNIVIDSGTKAEELCTAWVLANVKHEKGSKIERIEDYGFGKGYQHIYETFLTLLGDLDAHARAGRNIVMICHDCTAPVPNPHGDDWIRYEPRLQVSSSGKSSIRLRVREWADHLLFLGYDINVKDGKGKGTGTRTVYPCELPHCMAKSRVLSDPIPLKRGDASFWTALLK